MPAAQLGFALAQKLSLPVVLYHTTWSVPGLTATDPKEHMCSSAQAQGGRRSGGRQASSQIVSS
jgi:hypothetical protein